MIAKNEIARQCVDSASQKNVVSVTGSRDPGRTNASGVRKNRVSSDKYTAVSLNKRYTYWMHFVFIAYALYLTSYYGKNVNYLFTQYVLVLPPVSNSTLQFWARPPDNNKNLFLLDRTQITRCFYVTYI